MHVVGFIQRVLARFFAEQFFDRAAQTAYYLLLSVVPFLIFMLSLVSFFPIEEKDVLSVIRPYAPANTYEIIHENVESVLEKGKGHLISISFFSTFWLSSMAIQSLVRSLNEAYRIKRPLSFFKGMVRDLGVTLIFMFLVPLSLIVPLAERLLRLLISAEVISSIEAATPFLTTWTAVKWGLGTLFLFGFFILFYKILPSGKQKTSSVIAGAIFAAVSWQVMSVVFGEYAAAVNYTRIYGQLAGIVILTLWFYLTAIVLLLGGLINAELSPDRTARGGKRDKEKR
ncbi:YihY/virulence factor BrkB family protein [Bacillus badius]|uniref:Ribonuclease BN n=1 Tax=Bacillus badius TaxID=1455 RepID=A0ABR5AVA4_BACBA|nr:YihY/virulence factor BrkB family protein [Bacillus badius]KIL76422.1 Ribonuclease BN [Bacillus badius]KIL78540.1 Ribonuclease BN [Bacillus badius]MED4715963.1 YihY/virulence factor BrkB family protein [Bacillus badius]